MTRRHAISPVPATPLDARGAQRYTRAILATFRAADPDAFVTGYTWYAHAYETAEKIGQQTGLDARTVAGVIAALSPQNGWEKNITGAQAACHARSAAGLHTSRQTEKADAILAGADPLDVLNGPKERAFFGNIADPDDDAPVTIDRHAHDIAVGRRFGDEDRGLSSMYRYANLALAYRRAARVLGIAPNVVQAVTWQAWTGRTTLVILSDDQWNANADADVVGVLN